MATLRELETANEQLSRDLGSARQTIALLTAQKLALESKYGVLPPSVAQEVSGKELVEWKRKVNNLEAEVKELKYKHGEALKRQEQLTAEEIERAVARGREQAKELRATIATLSQQLTLRQQEVARFRSLAQEHREAAATAEEARRESQAFATQLQEKLRERETEVASLTEAVRQAEAGRAQAVRRQERLEERLALMSKPEEGRSPLARAGRASEEELESARLQLAQAKLSTRIAEQLAASLQEELRATLEELTSLRGSERGELTE